MFDPDVSASAIRGRLRGDKAFRAAYVYLGEPCPESGPAASLLRGWMDAEAGKEMDEKHISSPSAEMRPRGFNPVDAYRSGYISRRDGAPIRVRTLDMQNRRPA